MTDEAYLEPDIEAKTKTFCNKLLRKKVVSFKQLSVMFRFHLNAIAKIPSINIRQ